jgi:hypothetical protein
MTTRIPSYVLTAFVFATALVAGCSGSGGGNDNLSSVSDPDPPTINSDHQIDRMGRAGVNTATTAPFFRESVAEEQEAHDEVLDAYNSASDPSEWVDLFGSRIAGNIAILDSLDTVCGNQLLAGDQAVAGRYDALAGVLADDQLYVNSASGSCGQYLAVEGNAVGITNNDCGGRTPLEDTIDTTYSVLAIGALTGVGDGVPIDADGTASISAFPYLDTPNS